MNNNKHSDKTDSLLRYAFFIPLALMIASVVICCTSYSAARQDIANELNDAIFAMVNENKELWTHPDTISAIRHIHETTHKPLIYQALDFEFRNQSLKEAVYFTLAPAEDRTASYRKGGTTIASDSIILVPEHAPEGLAIRVQGFADCSMATVFLTSEQTLPEILLMLAIISTAGMFVLKRRENDLAEAELAAMPTTLSLDGIKLTPMQRQLTRMLLEAPGMKVDKRSLCEGLWGNKSNAEESLYTLVKRTKIALARANMEIVCNRGESYELRVND